MHRILGIALALALGLVPGLAACGSDEPKRPNVVLVSIDSLRRDHLGCYGYSRDTSPTIDRLAQQSGGWFPPGTGADIGKTRAKAEIWQKPQDFAAKDKAFVQAAREFKAAADSGDIDEIRGEAGDLGKACKACHDPYRAPEH